MQQKIRKYILRNIFWAADITDKDIECPVKNDTIIPGTMRNEKRGIRDAGEET